MSKFCKKVLMLTVTVPLRLAVLIALFVIVSSSSKLDKATR